jgi:hypothetical protein
MELGDIDGIAAAKQMSAIHGPRLNAMVDKRIGTDGKVFVIILHLTLTGTLAFPTLRSRTLMNWTQEQQFLPDLLRQSL